MLCCAVYVAADVLRIAVYYNVRLHAHLVLHCVLVAGGARRFMWFSIPRDLWSYEIVDLMVSLRTRNALRRHGFESLGNLHGVACERLLRLDGLGAKALLELEQELPFLEEQPPAALIEHLQRQLPVDLPADDGEVDTPRPALELGIEIHPDLWGCLVERLPIRGDSLRILAAKGVRTLGELHDCGRGRLASFGLVERQIEVVTKTIAALNSFGAERVAALCSCNADGDRLLPLLDLDTLAALCSANSLREEIIALTTDMKGRNADVVLRRWCFYGRAQPTLESLGDEYGVTRERIRQVVSGHDRLLLRSGLRLPIASSIVVVLESEGGVLTEADFVARIKDAGIDYEEELLATLPHLSQLDVIPSIRYSPELMLWLSARGEELEASGELYDQLREVRRRIGKRLSRDSVVSTEFVESIAPFGVEHAIRFALPRCEQVQRVGDYVVPLPVHPSALSRAVDKILTVSPVMPISSVHRGLQRVPRIKVPPIDVLAFVLRNMGSYVLVDEQVSKAGQLKCESTLSGSEQAAVRIFETQGEVLLHYEFIDAMGQAGYSVPMANIILMSAPFVRRISGGVYALRGRAIDSNRVHAKLEARQSERGRNVVDSRWIGDRLVARYRMTRFSLQGVLAQPRGLSSVVHIWRARFPDGREAKLKMRNGFLWSLTPWLRTVNAREGDVLVGTFYPAEAIVEWDYIEAGVD